MAYKSARVTVSAPTDFSGIHLDLHTWDRQRQVCFVVAADLSASSSLLTVITVASIIIITSVNTKGHYLTKQERQGIFPFIIAFLVRRHERDRITLYKKSPGHNTALLCCPGATKCQFHFFS